MPVLIAVAVGACGQSKSNVAVPQSSSPSPSAAPSPTATTASTADSWGTYHRDGSRAGYDSALPTPTRLTPLFSKKLDGAVYAEPIVVNNRLVVATESNTVYAFNAATGALLWQRQLARPVPRSALPCGNIDPEGITGTPAYDITTNRVFVVAEQRPGVRHDLYGLNLSSGAVEVHRSADPPNQDPVPMQERGALLVAHSRVYWNFGGLAGDCGDYHGHVVSVPTSGSGAMQFYRVPTPREAGIWTPPGPVLAPDGHIYVSAGNGESTSSYDGSDSVIELTADLKRVSYFAPTTWPSDNAGDLDLGSLAPALVGNNVFIAGKRGTGYLLKQGALGGIGGQLAERTVCKAFGGTARVGSTLFVPCTDGVRAVHVSSTNFTMGWHAASNITGSPVASPGAVWSLDPSAGRLYVLNSSTGHVITSHTVGTTTRFATPTIWHNEVFVGTESGIAVLRAA
jgi:outer membrane protein assembly factor BamB